MKYIYHCTDRIRIRVCEKINTQGDQKYVKTFLKQRQIYQEIRKQDNEVKPPFNSTFIISWFNMKILKYGL